MLKDKLSEVMQAYTSTLSLKSFGLYPGNTVLISKLSANKEYNQFLAKIVFTVQNGVINSLENTDIAKTYVDENKDGIYYTLASFNYAKKEVVTVLDFVAGGIEFLPLSTFKLDWDACSSLLKKLL